MSNNLKYYLAAYNSLAFVFWGLYFVSFIAAGFCTTQNNLQWLAIAQGMAILEIVHALLKWVKSPVMSTIAQVASRILVLVLIIIFSLNPTLWAVAGWGAIIVSVAWSITELIRYSYYFLLLFNIHPRVLIWMRYSFFIVLYPLGVTGEWLIILAPIIAKGLTFNMLFTGFVALNAVAYIYYFPVLYKYMWKQRKLKL